MADITGFIHLLSGAANGLLTLEGQNTTCADVFYVWVCIGYNLEQVLGNPSIGVSRHRLSVIETYNRRFNQMMTESSHHVFLLAYYLHPSACLRLFMLFFFMSCLLVFRHYGGLKLDLPVLPDDQTPKFENYPAIFITLLTSVLEIFKGEQLRLEDAGAEVVPDLIKEFVAYAHNKEPFRSHSWNRDTKPLKWWTHISKDSNARLISVCKIRILSHLCHSLSFWLY